MTNQFNPSLFRIKPKYRISLWFYLVFISFLFGGCAKRENPYFVSNTQINSILNQVESQLDSLPFIYNLPQRFYNQNSEDLIDDNELDSIWVFQQNLGQPSEYLPLHWGFTPQEFHDATQLKAENVFIDFDTVNKHSISSKIIQLSTAETYVNSVSKSLKEYNAQQQSILKQAIEIQSITSDSLRHYIQNINNQRRNKWISKSAYDAFLTNAHETFAEYFRLKYTEAKLDIKSSMNLKLLLDRLSADLSEDHWELLVSQLQKK